MQNLTGSRKGHPGTKKKETLCEPVFSWPRAVVENKDKSLFSGPEARFQTKEDGRVNKKTAPGLEWFGTQQKTTNLG